MRIDEGHAAGKQPQITGINPLQAGISQALRSSRGKIGAAKFMWRDILSLPSSLSLSRSLIPRTIFKFTTVSLGGRTRSAPRGLRCQMSDIKEEEEGWGAQGWGCGGRHTWSSGTWHLALAAVGLLTAAFLKAFLGKRPVCKCIKIGELNSFEGYWFPCPHPIFTFDQVRFAVRPWKSGNTLGSHWRVHSVWNHSV